MAWSALIPLGVAALNAASSNWNTNQSLSAQSAENAANRSYNLQLASLQNSWNREQWMRENEYNDPSAQLGRLRAAGINPDLIYSSGISNLSASSPTMTSGASSTPMDWSALASRKTIGDVLQDSLESEMMRAQINSVKADTKKTLADAGLSEISLEYADAQSRLGLKMSEQEYENAKQDYELGVRALEKAASELEGVTLDNAYKAIRNAFESEVFQSQIDILAEELKIKKAEAKNAMEYYAAQLLGIQADNAWKDAAWIVEQRKGVPTLIKYGSESVNKLIDVLVNFIPTRKPKGKSITINNNIPGR